MTQNATAISISASQSGTAFRTQHNNQVGDIATCFAGSSRPSYALPNMIWLNTAASPINVLTMYDGTDDIPLLSINTTTNFSTPSNSMLGNGANWYGADAVGSDAYAITVTGGAALTTGMLLMVKFGFANTGACTLAYNAGSALAIKKMSGTAYVDLADNDIIANQFGLLTYNGTHYVLLSTYNDAYFVHNQTAVTTLQTTDHLIISDDSDSDKNKKITIANVQAEIITTATAETTVASDDVILIYDTSATAPRKMTQANFLGASASVLTYVSTVTANNDATVDFTSLTTGTYIVVVKNWIPATDNAVAWVRVQSEAAFQADAADYGWLVIYANTATGFTANEDDADNQMVVSEAGVGSAAGEEGITGVFVFYNVAGTAAPKTMTFQGTQVEDAGILTAINGGGRYKGGNAAVTGVRFMFSTGDVESGVFQLYKLADS